MNQQLNKINTFLYTDFIFSPRYRVWRHIAYWLFHVTLWAAFWFIMGTESYWRNLFNMSLWIPVFILFSYPLVYFAVPHLLLKGRLVQFVMLILLWGIAGLFLNAGFRTYVYVPIQETLGFEYLPKKGLQIHSYLCMTTSAASPMIIKFFKLLTIKQRDWIKTQQERMSAELQLLKAQVHPEFLFNTLSNIYEFALISSLKTPRLILKLSSLLSYMLYDCKAGEVRLEKEMEMMKDYVDLEKERYGSKIDVSWNVEGNIKNHFIAPLLMLPFLENAFKHGTSDQSDTCWLSVDISVRQGILLCKIVNSKNEVVTYTENGMGINNVKKRLAFIYPGGYEVRMNDEGNFFVVTLSIRLSAYNPSEKMVPVLPSLQKVSA